MTTLQMRPFSEAIDFWRDKVQLSPREFYALVDAARTKAFTVSSMAKESEIADIFEAIERAIADGISFSEFKNSLKELFARKGWRGKTAWRIETIFRTNIQSAYNVGRYKQMADVARTHPYWMYSAVNDSRTRPLHLAMNGRVFAADDPIWDTWYPPNGFNCRCQVVSLTEGQLKRLGKTVEDGRRVEGRPIPLVDEHGQPTGMAQNLLPDPGWHFNPAKAHYGDAFFERAHKEKLKYSLVDKKGFEKYGRPKARGLPVYPFPEKPWRNISVKKARDRFKKLFGEGKVLKDLLGSPVVISPRLFEHLATKNPERLEYLPLIGDLVSRPEEIWLQTYQNQAGKIRLRRAYVKRYGDKGNNFLMVMDVHEGVWIGWTFLNTSEKKAFLDNVRKGLLLWPR